MNPRLLAVSLIALIASTSVSARSTGNVPSPRHCVDAGPFVGEGPEGDVRRKRITVRDLNLADPTGAATLRRRVDAAVIALSGGREASHRSEVRAARARARAQADALIAAART